MDEIKNKLSENISNPALRKGSNLDSSNSVKNLVPHQYCGNPTVTTISKMLDMYAPKRKINRSKTCSIFSKRTPGKNNSKCYSEMKVNSFTKENIFESILEIDDKFNSALTPKKFKKDKEREIEKQYVELIASNLIKKNQLELEQLLDQSRRDKKGNKITKKVKDHHITFADEINKQLVTTRKVISYSKISRKLNLQYPKEEDGFFCLIF